MQHATFRDVHIKDVQGEFKLMVQTVHDTHNGKAWATTAIQEQIFQRRIGGVRFVDEPLPGPNPEDLRELGELAEAMTWKSPLGRIPADGEKTIVYCPGGLPSSEDKVAIIVEHLTQLKREDPGVIFGPDIACGEQIMQLLADRHNEGEHVSGLQQHKGGLSIDSKGYTALGMEAALLTAARRLGWNLKNMKAVIGGFGAVGAHFGKLLRNHGVTIHAVGTKHGALIAETSEGLDIDLLFSDWQTYNEQGRNEEAFKQFKHSPPPGSRWTGKDEIWFEAADIFIPAARADVLAMPDEIAPLEKKYKDTVIDVTTFHGATGVKVLAEGANHPVTKEAERELEARGVFVLPDYLINCGGLIGCWSDWVYRKELRQEGEAGREWLERLNASVPHYIVDIIKQNVPFVLDLTRNQPKGMRQATEDVAARRREELAREFRAFFATNSLDPIGKRSARLWMDKLLQF